MEYNEREVLFKRAYEISCFDYWEKLIPEHRLEDVGTAAFDDSSRGLTTIRCEAQRSAQSILLERLAALKPGGCSRTKFFVHYLKLVLEEHRAVDELQGFLGSWRTAKAEGRQMRHSERWEKGADTVSRLNKLSEKLRRYQAAMAQYFTDGTDPTLALLSHDSDED